MSTKLPRNHLAPSPFNIDLQGNDGATEYTIHEKRITASCNTDNTTNNTGNKPETLRICSIFIRTKVVGVKDMKLDGSRYKADGINAYTAVPFGKQFLYQLVLSLL